MRELIIVDLRNDRTIYPAGYIGEINQRTLDITPPNDLKLADHFRLIFEVGDAVLYHPMTFLGGELIKAKIQLPVTSQPVASMALEAYNEDGSILGKSRVVKLFFGEAVAGIPMDFTGPPGENGATFIPAVDSGLLSWTNDKGLENPKTADLTGPPGIPGPPGQNAEACAISNIELDDLINGALSAIQPI